MLNSELAHRALTHQRINALPDVMGLSVCSCPLKESENDDTCRTAGPCRNSGCLNTSQSWEQNCNLLAALTHTTSINSAKGNFTDLNLKSCIMMGQLTSEGVPNTTSKIQQPPTLEVKRNGLGTRSTCCRCWPQHKLSPGCCGECPHFSTDCNKLETSGGHCPHLGKWSSNTSNVQPHQSRFCNVSVSD